MDPAQTVSNLIEIHKQFKEKVIYSWSFLKVSSRSIKSRVQQTRGVTTQGKALMMMISLQGLTVFLMSSPPVLVSEARLSVYSETWSAALAHQLASQCSQHQVSVISSVSRCHDDFVQIPYLPLQHCLYSEV